MLTEPTNEKLKSMRLEGMMAAWREQQTQPQITSLSFDERLGLLVDAEWTHRENARVGRALREAKLKMSQACIEDIDYPAKRELDKPVVRQLASCRWVHEHQAILITGATGTGKSYIACALAHQACRKGFRAIYRRASRLFEELALARADGTRSFASIASTSSMRASKVDQPSARAARTRLKPSRISSRPVSTKRVSAVSWPCRSSDRRTAVSAVASHRRSGASRSPSDAISTRRMGSGTPRNPSRPRDNAQAPG